jgi:hypothetical protein
MKETKNLLLLPKTGPSLPAALFMTTFVLPAHRQTRPAFAPQPHFKTDSKELHGREHCSTAEQMRPQLCGRSEVFGQHAALSRGKMKVRRRDGTRQVSIPHQKH